MKNACPTDCGNTVKPGQLLCPGCWQLLPALLRRTLYRAWAARWNAVFFGHSPDKRKKAAGDYAAARGAAIAAARERLIKKELSA